VKINWRLIVGILISLVAFWLIVKDVDPAQTVAAFAKANYLWLIPGTLFMIAAMAVRAQRWRVLLDYRLPLLRSFHIGNVGNMLNNVLPMRLGELGRAYLVSRRSPVSVMQCVSTIIVERLLDVLTVFGFLMVVLPLSPTEEVFARAGAITAGIAFAGVLGLFVAAAMREWVVGIAQKVLAWLPASLREKLLHQGDDFLRGIQSIGVRNLFVGVAWSVVTWIGWAGGTWMMLLAFVPSAAWSMAVFATCALALGLTIPSAPSGAGLYEAAGVAAMALFKVPNDVALAFSIALHVHGFIVISLFGIYGLDREGQSFTAITHAAQDVKAASSQ
jgi:uncharacterized protein (TIRG00374 family)